MQAFDFLIGLLKEGKKKVKSKHKSILSLNFQKKKGARLLSKKWRTRV